MTVVLCVICGKPLNEDEPWQTDISGDSAHVGCLAVLEPESEEERP